ncbi:MAG: DUF2892 domain-containing protein [Sphingobacteriales bacterium]|nr:MAG: DUF2892 domain-containing protein [Sphingobacteriales bacterium]
MNTLKISGNALNHPSRNNTFDTDKTSALDKSAAGLHFSKGFKWSLKETAENVGATEAIVRGLVIVLALPVLVSLDWSLHTDLLIFTVPVLFYLEVTAFTMFCPIKLLFSTYRLPKQFD